MILSKAFDRYAPLTDLAALKEYSARPLRKSVRVNTLKTTVEAFRAYAAEKRWSLTPVPWCPDGFFLERDSTGEALGKDLRHLIGHFYMQEAASMLPAALLDPQPGDAVLDMSAAPGSKTTQMAAMMQAGHPELVEGATRGAMVPFDRAQDRLAHHDTAQAGVIVANDVQEKRLWTLKASLHRSGVTNVLVTKKVGQWFARHMTERFDRVLCDAPCTAQGTARKDSDALRYCSAENIGTMARLQVALLVSAIHAAKAGGRIVYSTCTLTPEENEGVVLEVLKMLEGKVEVVDPRKLRVTSSQTREIFENAIRDSSKVQHWLKALETRNWKLETQPLLRLWPQTFDTEGFFCAVLEKKASTKTVEPVQWMHLQERPVSRKQTEDVQRQMTDRYGTSFLRGGERLLLHGSESLVVTTQETADFGLAVQDYAVGLPFGKLLKDGRVLLDHEQ
ncbi:hypothetical protein HYT95_02210, partial [Candidatus Peregrinibacteria bacterium]|nr:hypothetical protein [Candidatus Peregrinibacteria bacterium]